MTVQESQPVVATDKPITVRPASVKDAGRIAELGAHVFTMTFGHSVQPHELEAFLEESYTPSAITRDINDHDKDVIVATGANNDILGFAYLTRGSTEPCVQQVEKTVELQRIYVHPLAHGKGVGRVLERAIENMAREQGFKHIWLGVWEENLRAIKAYEKWGYTQVGDHDFVIGTVVQTDNIMLKAL
ncbi:hypothetical protein BHE90_002539 [Fusarium euwallaceae]|uniref:N-acetyltransferase domain-containing protein n=1 Tax=Fusarium euwallaceae TaxID=1147111 RepID=A0A430M4U0_9HYPO|nr:hypothetical protein BHE90_002539 [Fusarium euwallaceae]